MSLIKYKLAPKQCCECQACMTICPKKAISFKDNTKGYTYPTIDSNLCIDCGICDKICNINTQFLNNNFIQKTYIHSNNNKDIMLTSSSGGAFQSIIQIIFERKQNVTVYGAELCNNNNKLICMHTKAKNFNECQKFSGSKYIKSDITGIFNDISKEYYNKSFIIVSGLPCQIMAIKNYLEIRKFDLRQFLFIDLICHGVASQKFFYKLIEYIEHKYNNKVVDFKFRDKKQSWSGYPISVTLSNGKEIKNTALLRTFPILYLKGIITRESCFNCQFSSLNRVSDITLGDFWGELTQKNLLNKNGVSLIITNTERGNEIIQNLMNSNTLITRPIEINEGVKGQDNLKSGHKKPVEYDIFWKDFYNLSFYRLIYKYANYNYKGKLKAFVKKILLFVRRHV